MALLLAFDTATKHCAVALSEHGRLLAGRAEEREQYSHAERLNILIDEVMGEAGRKLDELGAVAVGIGPGSYTGLRIGLSAAKGLAFALEVPIIGLSTLDVLCAELRASAARPAEGDTLHPMVDARRMEVFTRTCAADGSRSSESRALILDRSWVEGLDPSRQHFVFGDGADKAAELWQLSDRVTFVQGIRPSLAGLVAASHAHHEQARFSDLAYLVPEYGKEAKLTQPK